MRKKRDNPFDNIYVYQPLAIGGSAVVVNGSVSVPTNTIGSNLT